MGRCPRPGTAFRAEQGQSRLRLCAALVDCKVTSCISSLKFPLESPAHPPAAMVHRPFSMWWDEAGMGAIHKFSLRHGKRIAIDGSTGFEALIGLGFLLFRGPTSGAGMEVDPESPGDLLNPFRMAERPTRAE